MGGSCCCVCIVHKGLTAGRSLSLSLSTLPHPCTLPSLTLPWPQSSARRAKSCKHFFFLFFCCLVPPTPPPLNRQIPDAIMRRLVKLSHSRTAQRSKAPSTGLGVQNTHRSCDKHPKYFVVSARGRSEAQRNPKESKDQQIIMTILKTA